ncbi:breast cancer type 1 susceptibility protein homolog isoform X1 [Syngnathus typhle]|uniref:breast cancer type 1 susceptibility protein homolog isoform X1 n=1 Tax=Syngnathus typhle TaxID=161592 RepID=UPI002A6A96F6|nr:breast cancer type 1 susceptibility protein homolog isoform X1 [Syngnathus typhle]XP_061119851.1 breast cancer type 1 susceptibility protein homolog isoform X1 [Syngnathus typhle]
MAPPKDSEVKRGIAALWETLQCPICLDLLTQPVSTKCDHQFCKFCMLKLLENTKQSRANCPVCKEKITKRSLQESPGFQRLVTGLQDIIQAYEHDTGTNYFTGLAQEGRRWTVNDDKLDDGTPNNVEGVVKPLPSSHSSSIAALNGFARVMGFGDSTPLMTEDQFQCHSVLTLQSIDSISATTVQTSGLATGEKKQKDQVVLENQPLTQSFGKEQIEEEPQIFERRKRKSKKRVAEWLLKVPAEKSLELEEPAEFAHLSDDSDSAASDKKEQIAKTVEEQVFGFTYRRKQRDKRSSASKLLSHTKRLSKEKNLTSLEEKLVDLEDPATMAVSEEPGNCESHKDLDNPPENAEMTSFGTFQPERTPTRLRSSLQQVDSDLQAKAETDNYAPKRDKRRAPPERGKSSRAVKPLVLVGVHEGDDVTKCSPSTEAVQVHIENYPSSEDQEAAVTTGTRRSKRLRKSSQNVRQPSPKKAATRRWAQTQGEDVKDGATSDPRDANACKSNGCVYAKDICGIETVEISHLESHVEGPPTENQVGSDSDPAEVPGSASLFGTAPEDPAPPLIPSAKMETEDCNDSEVDTAQLLRTFKATKRPSFHLSPSSGKKSRSEDEEPAHSPEKRKLTRSRTQRAKQQTTPRSDITGVSICSNLIPPTASPTKEMDAEGVAAPVPLGSSVSSALSQQKVPSRETESPLPSFIPQVVDSGLHFHKRQEFPESSFESAPKEDPGNLAEDPAAIGKGSARTSQHLLNADCSLTPDGLLDQPGPSSHRTQTSVQSSVRSNRIRNTRRRAQRLQHSLESLSSCDEEAPNLTQIFQEATRHPQDDAVQDATQANQHEIDDVAVRCQSPDCVTASQASVDLFDSPNESDLPADHASVPAELSQFGSEVLVTQQKVEMKNELVRLEKLMALVTEVLQEKEASSPARSDVQKSGPRDPDASGDPDRRDLAEGAEEPIREQLLQSAVQMSPPPSPRSGPAGESVADSNPSSSNKENKTPERNGNRAKMVLVPSGLGPAEQVAMRRFARKVGARVVSQVTAEVTHVVMCTDDQLVCERTLKYFLGIAGRKWVVSFQWIAECLKEKKLLDESLFEVRGDVVNGGDHLGPNRARTTGDDNLLMKGYEICLQGPFTNMTTAQMEWMVQLCGATVVKDLHSKRVRTALATANAKSNQLLIVQPGSEPCSYSGLAKQATVVTRAWLLDTVATYTFQGYDNYRM